MFHFKNLFSKQKSSPKLCMEPKSYGSGTKANYDLSMYSTQRIRWVSREKNELGEPLSVRIPSETSQKFSLFGDFIADGKSYQTWDQLCQTETETPDLYRDIYGRLVFYTTKLFPCFDSWDYIHENRRYRWFFILGDGKMTRVFYTDGRSKIHVTEDVECIEDDCWEELQKLPLWSGPLPDEKNKKAGRRQ